MSELGDALELLHGATGQVTTLTGTLLEWVDEERSMRAVEAFRRRHPDSGIAVLRHYGKGEPEPLRQYEQRTLVHYWGPNRYRLQRQANTSVHRPYDVLEVCDGEREWTYVAAERNAWVQAPTRPPILDLLDPSWLAAACILSVSGHTTYEGRPSIELHGRPRLEGRGLHHHHVGFGTEELQAVVDAETGLLLSLTSRFEGEPFRVERLDEVTIDQPLDEELFRFTPLPGFRFDDLLARKGRRPPMARGWLRLRLHLLRSELGRRIRIGRH
jgi:hypothetical protein